jgi:hypothetical protein
VKLTALEQTPGAVVVTMSFGQTIVGGCVSLTVTVNEQADDVRPPASVAVQLTVVGPFGNVEPDGGVQL